MRDTPLSLRDPGGRLVKTQGRILRIVFPEGLGNAQACLHSSTVLRWQSEGRFVQTREVAPAEWPSLPLEAPPATVLEHEAVPFPCYPSEWCPSMLRAAGLLTLDLASELLGEGLGLKDATPLNVLFNGSHPIFVDALSVEVRDARSPIWFAYGQFVRTFVLPLIASRHVGWSLRRTFTGARDGIAPEELYAVLRWRSRLSSGVFGAVTGPMLLSRLSRRTQSPSLRMDARRAALVLRALLAQLRGAIEGQVGRLPKSGWTSYRDPAAHSTEYDAARLEVVENVIRTHRPGRMLDVGANDGTFSAMAASLGVDVVAIDRDEAVIERALRQGLLRSPRVLPLVVDLTDPTPATGWRNEERMSFLQRATGGFDIVLCLAVLHHVVIGDGLPLGAAMSLMATMTKDLFVAEFVPVDDPFCLQLAAGRPVQPERWSLRVFEEEAERHFSILSRHPVGEAGRVVYVLRLRKA